jgi:hypothetical protein
VSTRLTSIEAYQKMKDRGLLSKRRLEVLEALVKIKIPSTQNEVYRWMVEHQKTRAQINGVNPRFAELEARKVIASSGFRKCAVTGERCMVWIVTGNLPVAPEPKKTVTQKLHEALAEINRLKERLAMYEQAARTARPPGLAPELQQELALALFPEDHKQAPADWERHTGIIVLEAHGWKLGERAYIEPITYQEFIERASKSKTKWPERYAKEIKAAVGATGG